MLIPSYTPDIRSGRSVSSSHSSQVYREPAIKGKRRSLVPTVSSLLLGTIEGNHQTEPSSDEIGDSHSMEAPIKNHEIPERPDVEDASKPPHSDYGPGKGYLNASRSCRLKAHRSEDINVRQDEDGVRTHCCPLDKSRRASPARNEDEDMFSGPSKLDVDAELFLKNFSLKSEEIQSLVAEKPPMSETDDENDYSDVDASTSMIYASHQNRQFVSTDKFKLLLDHQMPSLPSRKLGKNAMALWLEDSSDEEESSLVPSASSDRYEEMQHQQKYAELVESDMEEFEKKTEPKANGFEEVKLFPDSKQTNVINKNSLNNEESSNEVVEETHNDEKSNMTNISGIKVEKSKAKPENSSVLKTASGNNIQRNETLKDFYDQEQIDELVEDMKAVVELAILKAEVKLQKSNEEMLQNPDSDLKEKKFYLESEGKATEGLLLKYTDTEVKKTDDVLTESNIVLGKERGCETPEENAPIFKVYMNTENPVPSDASVRSKVSEGPGAEGNEMKSNFTMEPNSLQSKKSEKNEEIQPDLATALRFMTEVYPNTKYDELYLDTLSNLSDQSSEKSVNEGPKASTISRKPRNIQERSKNLEGGVPSTASGPFEPVIVEDQSSTPKRPRNKISKFFQSFKRRLAKKP